MAASDLIEQEIALTQAALEVNERAFLGDETYQEDEETIAHRLQRLQEEAEHIASWHELLAYRTATSEDQRIILLAQYLKKRSPPRSTKSFYWDLYEREFLPLMSYQYQELVKTLRKGLQNGGYPQEAQNILQDQAVCDSVASAIHDLCQFLEIRNSTLAHVSGVASPPEIHPVVVELVRPFAERVRHFFVEERSDRPTNAKIDRLPEWLLAYIHTNVFSAAPWEFICRVVATDDLAVEFVNEIIRLIQYVFAERNFFRHTKITATSILLSNAMEQLLKFDQSVIDLLPSTHRGRVVSLMDACVAGDEELLNWWLERERESVFALLNSAEIDDNSDPDDLVAPMAEVFCSILRSLQKKASVFSFSQPYLSQVAAPVCVSFLDALHETASELRSILKQRHVPNDVKLTETIIKWLELINGANMAVALLLDEFTSDDDMNRLGRSLERLRGAMIDDFLTDFVETVLMERAKLAGYLMRCSHVLSMDANEVDDYANVYGISVDLIETKRILSLVLSLCNKLRHGDGQASYAPKAIFDRVLSVLAEKFLEVALDLQGMTPDLRRPGCAIFARDVRTLFGDHEAIPKHARRIMDIASLMECEDLAELGNTLCSLCGRPAPLTEDIFEADSRLYEEAMSMVQAKGHVFVELADVFAVLNRRRDL